MKRPLVPIVLLYVGGILLGEFIQPSPLLLLSVAFALLLVALAWGSVRAILLYPLIFLTGWTGALLSSSVISPFDLRRLVGTEPQIANVRAVLDDTPSLRFYENGPRSSFRTLAHATVSAIQFQNRSWQPASGGIVVGTPGALTNFFAGQAVEIVGVISPPKHAFVGGLFDYREYLRRLGIHYELQASSEKDWQILSSPTARPLADRFRDWGRAGLARGLPHEDESLRLQWALTLGWKPALTEEVSEPFVQAATYHIFAVDGLRMAILFGILFGLFRVIGLPRAISGIILIPIIWFYVALTGWPASAIRATVMLTIIIVGWTLKRPSDMINSLFAAALIILVWQPQQLFQAGFQLSFFVVLSLILILPVIHDLIQRTFAPDPLLPVSLHRRWPEAVQLPARYVWEILLTSFAAWIGSLPLVAYYFNIFTPVSTPANLLAVPLCALVLISDLASLLLVGWFPAAAELFNHAGWALMECIRTTSNWFADLPAAYYYVSSPSWTTTALYYGALVGIATGWLFLPRWRAWKLTTVAVLAVWWLGQTWQNARITSLTILPENGAGVVYVDAPGRKNDVLIDCGSESSVESVTKPFLRSRGVNRLLNLALTHGDTHRVGGALRLDELFPVENVWVSSVNFRSPAYRQTIAAFNQFPGKLKTINRGDQLCSWTVLHPEPTDHFPQADDNTFVLTASIGPARLLLLSDLGRPGQSALLRRYPDLRADIVVSGLPVATEALSDSLLETVRPRIVIVTDSQFPASARAGLKLHERLANRNVQVLYTRSCGAIIIEFTKTDWVLRTMNGQTLRGRN